MGLSFTDIKRYFLSSCGDEAVARAEWTAHVSEGYRRVCAKLDLPELQKVETVTVLAGTDKVSIPGFDANVYAILNVFDVTDGYPLRPEPDGMVGRDRYLVKGTTSAIPPAGAITNYIHDGTSLYVRYTPTYDTVLQVRVRQQPPNVTEADATNGTMPLTPDQYDWAIVHYAVANFYMVHPDRDAAQGEDDGTLLSQRHLQAAEDAVSGSKDPVFKEERSRYDGMRLRGRMLMPRTRTR
jgi:hypothetical protein